MNVSLLREDGPDSLTTGALGTLGIVGMVGVIGVVGVTCRVNVDC